jgi:protein-L-isoaspartate(D-aspartate) O-methyltransferase
MRPRFASGLGLDNPAMRLKMVERLRKDGIANELVLEAMTRVPRHSFVDTALAAQAYEDTSLPIGHGQTISKPSVVARMLEWLMLGATARSLGHLGRVLEIGTGCGYQAAVLAHLAGHLVSIERIEALHRVALDHLARFTDGEVALVHGDGMLGFPAGAPFDTIVAAAGGDDLPEAWLAQLALGGRLVAPSRGSDGRQTLIIVDRIAHGYRHSLGEQVQFVPLKSGTVLAHQERSST